MSEDRELPRDNLFRMITQPLVMRDQKDGDGLGELFGHFAVFNRWTQIDSFWEGNFMERIAPGAFEKTIKENRASIRVLFQHGRDAQIGDKVLAKINDLREDDEGAFYAADLYDTSWNRDLLPALKDEQYGASFRMRVMREDLVRDPEPSEENPQGLDERTIKEIRLYEFGPVTFPAYTEASAGVRSITDDMIEMIIRSDPERVKHLLGIDLPAVIKNSGDTPPATAPADAGSSTSARRLQPLARFIGDSNPYKIKKKEDSNV